MTNLHRRRSCGPYLEGALGFSKVYEDPGVDIAALAPVGKRLLAISSGGCTALGLLAGGAAKVIAVDINTAQNHHVELQHAALRELPHAQALALLGAAPATGAERTGLFARVSPRLSARAGAFWTAHPALLRMGAIRAGTTDRGMRALTALGRHTLTGRGAMTRLLACTTTGEQQEVFDALVDTRRWRATLALVMNPVTSYPMFPQFFDLADAAAFRPVARAGIRTAFRDIPIWRNWYLHDVFEGHYRPDCLPPHLAAPGPGPRTSGELEIVDGAVIAVLNQTKAGSLDGVWLSNVGEWLPGTGFTELLEAAARATAAGGRVVWNNVVPRAEPIPPSLRERLLPLPRGTTLDRSLLRYQRMVCEVAP